jgi:non-ribosomal peptide synthetase component F
VEMVVALLGVLKAGGAYVPLDPAISSAATDLHESRHAQLAVLLTQGALAEQLPAHEARVVHLESDCHDDCRRGVSCHRSGHRSGR